MRRVQIGFLKMYVAAEDDDLFVPEGAALEGAAGNFEFLGAEATVSGGGDLGILDGGGDFAQGIGN